MSQPQWITPAGDLGTIPEKIFYRVNLRAEAPGQNVLFRLIAGQLPEGIQVTANGNIEGVPKTTALVQGVPTEVSRDVTSKFAIRAYTTRVVNNVTVVDRVADRTFTMTVTGQDIPDFVTPPGLVGTFYDGTEASVQINFTDDDLDDEITVKLASGTLPPGLVLDPRTGLISGVIVPLIGPPGTARPGEDATPWDEYPWDFTTRSTSKNFQFTLEITDGKNSNLRTFEIFVYSKDSMSADTTDFTADNTYITADVVPTRTPVLLTPEGDLGRVRADNFYAFKFDAIDFDGDAIQYDITTGSGVGYDGSLFDENGIGFDRGFLALPPGLIINSSTGWFYGYIPDQGATEATYQFSIRVRKAVSPLIVSQFYFFSITIIGDIETDVIWLTAPDLGSINNGAVSTLSIQAFNVGGRSLQYRLAPGLPSRLPQGLTLFPSGNIIGKVSFNTFAIDSGATTFDVNLDPRLGIDQTTFDLEFRFTVNAFATQNEQLGFQVQNIIMTNGGSGYTSQPTVTISAPPDTENSIQATTGVVTIINGAITNIEVGNPGRGYTSTPQITITGGGGSGATATATIVESTLFNSVSVNRTFVIRVIREYDEPYQTLYIKAMPPQRDRDLIENLLLSQELIPENLVYRKDDPNFGVADYVRYDHAYGLTAATIDEYVASLDINHYHRNLTLGEIKTAQALDAQGNVQYEVVYSEIIDNLENAQGESVGKSVKLAFPVDLDGETVATVFPNSLDNMRDQVIDTVGQISPALPAWMTSKQADGRILGFTPAWVICYAKPGEAGRIAYNINTRLGTTLNVIDFDVDRYELDRSQTYLWDPETQKWIPSPAAATTFDRAIISFGFVNWLNQSAQPVIWVNDSQESVRWNNIASGISFVGTIFDGGTTTFAAPADRWTEFDTFDKYLLFPRVNILG